MSILKEKIEKMRSSFIPGKSVSENIKHLKEAREGDYLIKYSKNSDWSKVGGVSYMEVSSMPYLGGWSAWGIRKNAMWFTAKEASEYLKGKKGKHMVKLSKNRR